LVDEAEVEHATAKELLARILGSSADEPMFDATVKVQGESINHHIKARQKAFSERAQSQARHGGVDQIAARKAEVKQELGAAVAHN